MVKEEPQQARTKAAIGPDEADAGAATQDMLASQPVLEDGLLLPAGVDAAKRGARAARHAQDVGGSGAAKRGSVHAASAGARTKRKATPEDMEEAEDDTNDELLQAHAHHAYMDSQGYLADASHHHQLLYAGAGNGHDMMSQAAAAAAGAGGGGAHGHHLAHAHHHHHAAHHHHAMDMAHAFSDGMIHPDGGQIMEHIMEQKPRRERIPWTEDEIHHLRAGVAKHGFGKWVDILNDKTFVFNPCRNKVDLKDKWRNLENYKTYAEHKLRRYVLLNENHEQILTEKGHPHYFNNRWPRDAALKIAARDEFYPSSESGGPIQIYLKEVRSEQDVDVAPIENVVHVYLGSRMKKPALDLVKFSSKSFMWSTKVIKVREEKLAFHPAHVGAASGMGGVVPVGVVDDMQPPQHHHHHHHHHHAGVMGGTHDPRLDMNGNMLLMHHDASGMPNMEAC